MPSWEWERRVHGGFSVSGHRHEDIIERAETDGLTPPPGEGWKLVSKFGVGKVKGAGNSPARSS